MQQRQNKLEADNKTQGGHQGDQGQQIGLFARKSHHQADGNGDRCQNDDIQQSRKQQCGQARRHLCPRPTLQQNHEHQLPQTCGQQIDRHVAHRRNQGHVAKTGDTGFTAGLQQYPVTPGTEHDTQQRDHHIGQEQLGRTGFDRIDQLCRIDIMTGMGCGVVHSAQYQQRPPEREHQVQHDAVGLQGM